MWHDSQCSESDSFFLEYSVLRLVQLMARLHKEYEGIYFCYCLNNVLFHFCPHRSRGCFSMLPLKTFATYKNAFSDMLHRIFLTTTLQGCVSEFVFNKWRQTPGNELKTSNTAWFSHGSDLKFYFLTTVICGPCTIGSYSTQGINIY
jgi:hypothetical protein